jgi:hypothetical protein
MSVAVMCSRKRRLWPMVAPGRSFTSSFRSTWAFWSTKRGRPGLFLGVRDSPCRTLLAYRLTLRRGSRRRCELPQPWAYPAALKRRLSSCGGLRNRLSSFHDRIRVKFYAHCCRPSQSGEDEAFYTHTLRGEHGRRRPRRRGVSSSDSYTERQTITALGAEVRCGR